MNEQRLINSNVEYLYFFGSKTPSRIGQKLPEA